MRSLLLIATATLAVALAGSAVGESADSYAGVRKEFQEAYAEAGKSDSAATHDSEALKGYPLYPYLQAERFRKALGPDATTPEDVDKRAAVFVAEHDPQPVARRVRRVWLESLARRAQWAVYLEAYRAANPDDALRCQSFVARIALDKTDGLVRDISAQWLITPRSLPECKIPFDWMKEQGVLTTDLIEQRVRLALKSGDAPFAKQMIELLPAERAAPLTQWVALLEKPQPNIDALIASPAKAVDGAALLAGWSRLTRVDPTVAKERYTQFVRARDLSSQSASPYARALALRLAFNRDPAALDYFPLVSVADRDIQTLEWWTRAALWSGDWKRAAETIASMPDARRDSARWRYWSARAAEHAKDSERAQRLYDSLRSDDNFYSAMAAGHLKRSVAPNVQALPAAPEIQTALDRLPAFVRARELFLSGLRQDAALEWQFGFQSLSEPQRRQSIHLAASWGWYDQAVATATAERVFNDYDLLYPRPFDAEVLKAAQTARVPPELVYGVIRQESLYRTDAVSSAGARGLMQLQIDTARSTARFLKLPKPELTDLFVPAINTSLGAGHLRMLLDRFDGQLPVALAGYNAGPNAAARWLPEESIDADVWIENIPYDETREYVQRILWHRLMFAWLADEARGEQTGVSLAPITALRPSTSDVRLAGSE
ncbi:MAG: transglycosylase SLT domain-containing protein [Gammaproteobacteria bacterium]